MISVCFELLTAQTAILQAEIVEAHLDVNQFTLLVILACERSSIILKLQLTKLKSTFNLMSVRAIIKI